ncbi:helix-turn-helix domain-containing protein [Streptomyces sp. NPDC052013]|uniref:helix-turn-helix domain-containing protein n=1 Tax=Streptomyces sp. NPDC052013 TaxID=3365679 RepID=UPI0037CECC7C
MWRFDSGQKNREIAAALRVSERSVERWRRAWRENGKAEVASKGSPGRPRLIRSKSPGWSVSWRAVRWCTAGRTSGGRSPG